MEKAQLLTFYVLAHKAVVETVIAISHRVGIMRNNMPNLHFASQPEG
jgi:hypothetical protein